MSNEQYRTIDPFDATYGNLKGLPEVTWSKETTIQAVLPLIGATQVFVLQTGRQREIGDFCFLTFVDSERSVRIVLPPRVCEAIARQRDALTVKVRKRTAKASAAARKAQGIPPAFLNGRKQGGKRSPKAAE